MNHEQEPQTEFWTIEKQLAEGVFFGEAFAIRARAHIAEEPYRGRREIVSLTHSEGMRDYILIHPYILLPEISLTVGLTSEPVGANVVGTVLSSEWEGMRQERIGDGQAWYYRPDRTLVLWELNLFERYQQDDDPCYDPNLQALWQGFERFLLDRFPDAQRIVTPAWEPGYAPATWHAFLSELEYAPLSDEAFGRRAEPSGPRYG